MGWTETECPKCGVRLRTCVRGMGVPGGKEREEGFCPICGALVISEMTDGFVYVEVNSSGGFMITNPYTGNPITSTSNGASLVGATFNTAEAAQKFIFQHLANPVLAKNEPVKGGRG